MTPKFAARRVVLAATTLLFAACSDASGPTEPANLGVVPPGQERVAAMFEKSSPVVLAIGGTVFADHDEVNGRLLFGVENEAVIPGVQRALDRLGIPTSAYAIQVTAPIIQMATLRDRFRPTQGGIQIHFGQYLCTMGFNVTHAGGRSFITNSHCTNTQGGVEGTRYYQPTSTVDPTVIATEADDPVYVRGGTCPKGKKCRWSDASRALYSDAVASNQGEIAKTTGANNNSLTTSGFFTVTSQDNTTQSFPVGTIVNKVGRTTGWSQGRVTNTCVNTSVQGSSIMQRCQTFVSAGVGSGDSGSPVFKIVSGDNVELVGILWGGSSDNRTFVFSPLKNIQDELGAVTATK